MAVILGILGGCAYDPAYSYGSSNSYYGGSDYRNPNYGYSGYSHGYRNGYYNTGSPGYGYYNGGYRNERYCPDDDDD
jgi:hypothetical protein